MNRCERPSYVGYGAGNVGRSFRQVFHDSGYEVIFVDINRAIIDALNFRGGYTLRAIGNGGDWDTFVDSVRESTGTVRKRSQTPI